MPRYRYLGDTDVLSRVLAEAGLSLAFIGEIQRLMPYRRFASFLSQLGPHQDDPEKVAAILAQAETQLKAVRCASVALEEILLDAMEQTQPPAPAKGKK